MKTVLIFVNEKQVEQALPVLKTLNVERFNFHTWFLKVPKKEEKQTIAALPYVLAGIDCRVA